MSPSKLLIALITLPAATSYKTSQRLRGAAKKAATPSTMKRGAGARLAVNQLDALKDILATANEDGPDADYDETYNDAWDERTKTPQGDISELLEFSREAELEQFWLEEAEAHAAEDNWAASYDARADALSQGAVLDEDVFDIEMERKAAGTKGEPDEDVDDGAAYQDDYADILVEEAEDRYKDILDYTDYEYAADGEEEEGAAWRCDDGGCHEVDGDADYADDDEHKGLEYADADDETQESATWRCDSDGCHQVVDDDEHKDGDEPIEEDYYDDDYEN